jgi:hypothetical protein
MAQAVGCGTLTMEAQVQFQVSPCGMCDGQSGTGTDLSLTTLISLISIIQPTFHINSLNFHRHYIIQVVNSSVLLNTHFLITVTLGSALKT